MYHLLMAIVGLLALAAVMLPLVLRDRLISYPLLVVATGGVVGAVVSDGVFDPVANGFVTEHLSEFAVIVALTGLGLSIDRPMSLRGWATTWRLLAITMPLTIAFAMLTGWWLVGLAPAAALMFGAALAPTDPVLAADVQTGPPTTGDPHADETDEVRFGLTSESSLNDGLAFPFVNLAILLAGGGVTASTLLGDWLLIDVAYKIGGGVLYGFAVGRVFGWLTIRLVGRTGVPGLLATAENAAPTLMALAFTFVSFGITEVLGAYGFIAVFVSAYAIRNAERQNDVHDALHEGAEQLERLAMSLVLLLLGAAFTDRLHEFFSWDMVGVALLLILVVRPLAGLAGLARQRSTSRPERAMIAFFGIRGLGSIYYLAYGLNRIEVSDAGRLWTLTVVVIVASLLIHGVAARPAMIWLAAQRGAADPAAAVDDPDREGPALPG